MTSIKFNPQQVRRDRGYCYLILFSDGVIKGGSTIDPYRRFMQHRADAEKSGKTVERVAITNQHKAYKQTESKILKGLLIACKDSTGEYFKGVSFSEAAEVAESCNHSLKSGSKIIKVGSYKNQKIVSLRIEEPEYIEIERAAIESHLKVSTWIKQALKEEIAREGRS